MTFMVENSATAAELQSPSPWFVIDSRRNSDRSRIRLFCFHYAGASASIFRSWQQVIPESVELVAVQLPGREYRLVEPPMSDMKEIVSAVAEVLPPLLDKPFVFYGHSMGALIAFDLIRSLRAQGFRQPELLIVSGRDAPQFQWRDPAIRLLSDDELVDVVRDYNGTPEGFLADETLRELWLPRFRSDLTASVMYEYIEQPPLGCPIIVMFGAEDPLVSDTGLKGWIDHTKGNARFFCYPGDHFFLHTAEHLMVARIRAELEEILSRTTMEVAAKKS